MKHYFTSKLLLLVCVLLGFSGNISAQNYKTVKLWDFTKYSEETIANLAAGTDTWTATTTDWKDGDGNPKGVISRYANTAKALTNPIKANGTEIAEFEGFSLPSTTLVAKAVTLRFNMPNSNDNGFQNGKDGAFVIKDLKAGQKVTIIMSSAKSTSDDDTKNAFRGIASVTNLEGKVGPDTYKEGKDGDMTYELIVKEDGDCSYTTGGGVILKSIKVEEEATTPKVAFLCTAAYDAENDPSYKALAAIYDVAKVDIATVSDPITLLSYDLVVVNSSIDGKDGNAKKLSTIVNAVPMLNFKSFFYNTGRWDWATGANPSPASRTITVQDASKSHVIFDGVNVAEDGTLTLFNEVEVADKKNLVQGYNDPAEIIANDEVLAKVGEINAIHEHKAESGKNTYMLIPFEQTYATSLTNDAVKLITNAAAYLIATKAISATVEAPEVSSVQEGKEVKVTITCATADATIYYTLDGSEPTNNSKVYTTPFNIYRPCMVKAVAMKEDMVNSEVAEQEIENPNYVARNKTILWINFDDQPLNWREGIADDNKDLTGKNGATGTYPYGEFTIDVAGARVLLMGTGVNEEVGSDYGPATEADAGASSRSLQIGKGKNTGSAYVISSTTYQGPFDFTAWWSSTSGNDEKLELYVKKADASDWIEVGTTTTSAKKKIKKSVISYEGTDEVQVKFGGRSGGQFNIFDIKLFGEGQDPVSITNEEINKEIEACEYYSISGMRLARPEKGINLVKTIYTDGSIETSKVVVK